MKTYIILLGLILVIVIAGGFYFFKPDDVPSRGEWCTPDVMRCPDGSYTGRSGPDCAFLPCPEGSAEKTSDWGTYHRNTEWGFELAYPTKYPLIKTGWLWGDFDVHFVDESDKGVHVSAEAINGRHCFLNLCDQEEKSQRTINGIMWDYVGKSGYGDVGESFEGREVYRTVWGEYRYYLHFDSAESQENESVVKNFKFIN